MAERSYVAERASKVEIRRNGSGASITLADSVDAVLADMGLYPDEAGWDAWRRVDGKWIIAVTHPGLPAGTIATWTYDPTGRNLHPLDEVARRFMETGFTSVEDFLGQPDDVFEDEASAPQQRPRLVAVPGSTTADTTDVNPVPPHHPAYARTPAGGSLSRQPTVTIPREATPRPVLPRDTVTDVAGPAVTGPDATEPMAAGSAGSATPGSATPGSATAGSEPSTDASDRPATAPKSKSRGKGRRASVPSWDEILFGASKHDDR